MVISPRLETQGLCEWTLGLLGPKDDSRAFFQVVTYPGQLLDSTCGRPVGLSKPVNVIGSLAL